MSPRKRRLLWYGLFAAPAAFLLGAWLLWPRTAITAAGAAKIEVGMTLAEVEAILGGPARDESTGPLEADLGEDTPADRAERMVAEEEAMVLFYVRSWEAYGTHEWRSDRAIISMSLNPEEVVSHFLVQPVRRAYESPLDKFRRWLGF
jgi:hypothetical protein